MCSSIMRAISSIETAADALPGIASSRSARSAPGCAHGWWCADDAGAGPPLAAAAAPTVAEALPLGLGTSEMGVKAGAGRPRMPPRAAAAAVVARPVVVRSAALPRTRAASSSCRSAARAPG